MHYKLIQLANYLDDLGCHKEVDYLDDIIKNAQMINQLTSYDIGALPSGYGVAAAEDIKPLLQQLEDRISILESDTAKGEPPVDS